MKANKKPTFSFWYHYIDLPKPARNQSKSAARHLSQPTARAQLTTSLNNAPSIYTTTITISIYITLPLLFNTFYLIRRWITTRRGRSIPRTDSSPTKSAGKTTPPASASTPSTAAASSCRPGRKGAAPPSGAPPATVIGISTRRWCAE